MISQLLTPQITLLQTLSDFLSSVYLASLYLRQFKLIDYIIGIIQYATLIIVISINTYMMLRDSIREVIHQIKKIVYQKNKVKIVKNDVNEIST